MQVCVSFSISTAAGYNQLAVPNLCTVSGSGAMQVCVPFSAGAAVAFDPDAVPTVSQLLDELGAATLAEQFRPDRVSEWDKTALAGCMTAFCRYVSATATAG